MATIAEFREFFFRATPVTSGSKPDKETGFPTQYVGPNGTLVYNRLLKGHYPNEAVFKKLLQSVAFKLNPEDTASSTQQGLVKSATDAEVIAKTASYADSMTRTIQPYQVPDVEEDDTMDVNNASTDDGASGIRVTDEVYTLPASSKTRTRSLISTRELLYRTFTNLVSVLTGATTLWTKIIPIKGFSTDGDTISIDLEAVVNNLNTNSKAVKLYINATLVAALDIAAVGDQSATLKVTITKQSDGTNSVVLVSSEIQYIDGSFVPTTKVIVISNPITLTGIDLSDTAITLSLIGQCSNAADVVTVCQSSVRLAKY